ncbi:hypothetical protein OUZ56_005546 [Daphnia magna]|uniref:Uncharacterized protein n=1 Tax=Daphnia magna TaxID=35525 RepID=A0ABQ9YT29_9CRUS|nr:hypothetical protein OUZ56_005546 [Daphnia magna]
MLKELLLLGPIKQATDAFQKAKETFRLVIPANLDVSNRDTLDQKLNPDCSSITSKECKKVDEALKTSIFKLTVEDPLSTTDDVRRGHVGPKIQIEVDSFIWSRRERCLRALFSTVIQKRAQSASASKVLDEFESYLSEPVYQSNSPDSSENDCPSDLRFSPLGYWKIRIWNGFQNTHNDLDLSRIRQT